MARSWARRSFAAETIFMALVICRVFFTLRMRRRRSSTFAIGLLSEQWSVNSDQRMVERLSLSTVHCSLSTRFLRLCRLQIRHKIRLVLFQRRVQAVTHIVIQLFLL